MFRKCHKTRTRSHTIQDLGAPPHGAAYSQTGSPVWLTFQGLPCLLALEPWAPCSAAVLCLGSWEGFYLSWAYTHILIVLHNKYVNVNNIFFGTVRFTCGLMLISHLGVPIYSSWGSLPLHTLITIVVSSASCWLYNLDTIELLLTFAGFFYLFLFIIFFVAHNIERSNFYTLS